MVIFIAFFFFGCHDVLILGKSPIKWRHCPEMTIAVDCDAKLQLKQTIKLFSHNQSSAFLKYLDRFALLHKLHVNQSGEMLVEQMYISIPNVSCILEFKMRSSMGNYCWNYIVLNTPEPSNVKFAVYDSVNSYSKPVPEIWKMSYHESLSSTIVHAHIALQDVEMEGGRQ